MQINQLIKQGSTIALNDKKKSSLATKIDSLSSLTLFITVIHSWMSVYPYFNRMLCVRFFFTLLYTKLTVLCYRWTTITSINHPVMSRTEINLIINFLLFNAKCIHSLQNICTRYYSLYIFASLGLQQNAVQTMQTLWHAPGMAIHTLPFILPLHDAFCSPASPDAPRD